MRAWLVSSVGLWALLSLSAQEASAKASCDDLKKFSKDMYQKLKEVGQKYGCLSPVPVPTRYGACFLGPQILTGFTQGVLGAWNSLAKGGWGTIGPRTLGVDPEKGKLVAGTKRTFLTSFPANSDEIEIRIQKTGGKAEANVLVCKLTEDGRALKLGSYLFQHGSSLSTKTFTYKGVQGNLVGVILDEKAPNVNTFSYQISAKAWPKKWNFGPIQKGYADLHVHLATHLAFGGVWLHNSPARKLTACGGKGSHAWTAFVPHEAKLVHGKPGKDWPVFIDTGHQQSHADALKAALQAGLKLVVVSLVNNEWLCNALKLPFPRAQAEPCDDMYSAHKQLDWILGFARDNHTWFELAMDPWHARKIIQDGKMAAIVSLEVSQPFPVGQGDWKQQLDRLYFKGLRSLQLAHETDSAFAGAAHHHGLLFPALEWAKNPVKEVAQLAGKLFDLIRGVRRPKGGGLTSKGRKLVAELVKRKMVIDACHLSERATRDLYEEVKAKHRYYPIYISHTRFQPTLGQERIKKQGDFLTTDEQAAWFRKTGGVVGLRTGPDSATEYCPERKFSSPGVCARPMVRDSCAGSATSLVQDMLHGTRKLRLKLALGSDINGFVPLTGPRWGKQACPANAELAKAKIDRKMPDCKSGKPPCAADKPPKAPRGSSPEVQRAYETYREKGFASVAQIPALIDDMRSMAPDTAANLDGAAEEFIKMWERAYDAKRGSLP
jgi:microsomal dipeptidase-like Zn-dependent dipeptidase